MTTFIDLGFNLTAPGPSFDPSSSTTASITKPKEATLIAAGTSYLAYAQRTLAQRSFEDDDAHRAEQTKLGLQERGALIGVEDDLGVGDEEESPDLLVADPKKWKDLDQYAVLGLSHLRYRATDEQIKIAHRKKVLKHHPDKKANQGDSNDDAFFKCIQKAYEVLMHADRRRQFDSIDPYYLDLEDDVPTAETVERAKDPERAFFQKFGPVFEREAHFCASCPEEEVPKLGTMNSTKEEVERFYDFWYNFDSWRTFEWFDKEINEGSNSRDDKRYTEKKNKNERARRKKDDNARLRTFIDTALSVDPRIKKIKQQEKEAREQKQKARQGGRAAQVKLSPKEKAELEKKTKEEEAKKKEEEEKIRVAEKKARDAAKKKAKRAEKAAAEAAGGSAEGAPAA
ncbi:hypothetical protein M407DRAFT_243304 [Tulasnella calospora MUT 4182]|uniref:J domain-containing protein n=1 Tax=Tulasnella calospora MUT 4182 TaxID=1051891 RepID=A0A0C3L1K6_9AGAM|nr:hypothetical protein M407DRAFT_243304 [Tulasnella calospora MUT 4182]